MLPSSLTPQEPFLVLVATKQVTDLRFTMNL